MSIYHLDGTQETQIEAPIYGSSRLGITKPDRPTGQDGNPTTLADNEYLSGRKKKFFEISNHLGNVLTVVEDQILGSVDGSGDWSGYQSIIARASDYYPFGLEMPDRSITSDVYRCGFNGKERDGDLTGNDGLLALDYGFRIYNPAVGRFLSVDPLTRKYGMLTPYQFASNTPIAAIDLDGLESIIVHLLDNKTKSELNVHTRAEIIKSFEERMSLINVNLKIEFIEDSDFYTKEDFYKREGAHWSDSYILLGRAENLTSISTEDLGWDPVNWHSRSHIGLAGRSNGIAKIGIENSISDYQDYMLTRANMNTPDKEWLQSYKFAEAMSLVIEHESLHPKLRFNPNNRNGVVSTADGVPGHISGNIMGGAPLFSLSGVSQNNYYDTYTSTLLKRLHGLLEDGGFTFMNDTESLSDKLNQYKQANSDASKVEESFKETKITN